MRSGFFVENVISLSCELSPRLSASTAVHSCCWQCQVENAGTISPSPSIFLHGGDRWTLAGSLTSTVGSWGDSCHEVQWRHQPSVSNDVCPHLAHVLPVFAGRPLWLSKGGYWSPRVAALDCAAQHRNEDDKGMFMATFPLDNLSLRKAEGWRARGGRERGKEREMHFKESDLSESN